MVAYVSSRARVVLFLWEPHTNLAIPMATATARAKQMRYLFEVTREIEFLSTSPLAISLDKKSHVLSSFVKMTLEECALPVENQDVRRVQ